MGDINDTSLDDLPIDVGKLGVNFDEDFASILDK